jgi:hypothetical protein
MSVDLQVFFEKSGYRLGKCARVISKLYNFGCDGKLSCLRENHENPNT